MKKRHITTLLLGTLLVACTENTAPPVNADVTVQAHALQPVPWQSPAVAMSSTTSADSADGDTRVLRAPGIYTYDDSASVWAVRGQNTFIRMKRTVWVCEEGECEWEDQRHSSITIPANALLVRPDGTPIAQNDSILVSLVADENTAHVHLYPSGLQFNENDPAVLRVYYDDSGMSSSEELALDMWYQAFLNDPWSMIQADQDTDGDRFIAELNHFSGYAVAY